MNFSEINSLKKYFQDTSNLVSFALGALRKVAKIKKEEPLYKIYEEILLQRILIWTMIIPLTFNKINVFLWK